MDLHRPNDSHSNSNRLECNTSEMTRVIAFFFMLAVFCTAAVEAQSNCDCKDLSDVIRMHNDRLSELVNYERHTRLLLEWQSQVMSVDNGRNDFYIYNDRAPQKSKTSIQNFIFYCQWWDQCGYHMTQVLNEAIIVYLKDPSVLEIEGVQRAVSSLVNRIKDVEEGLNDMTNSTLLSSSWLEKSDEKVYQMVYLT